MSDASDKTAAINDGAADQQAEASEGRRAALVSPGRAWRSGAQAGAQEAQPRRLACTQGVHRSPSSGACVDAGAARAAELARAAALGAGAAGAGAVLRQGEVPDRALQCAGAAH